MENLNKKEIEQLNNIYGIYNDIKNLITLCDDLNLNLKTNGTFAEFLKDFCKVWRLLSDDKVELISNTIAGFKNKEKFKILMDNLNLLEFSVPELKLLDNEIENLKNEKIKHTYIKEYKIKGMYGEVKFEKETIKNKISVIEDIDRDLKGYGTFDIYLWNKDKTELIECIENVKGLPDGITNDIYYKMATIQSLNSLQQTIVLANGGTIIKKDKEEINIDKKVNESLDKILKDTFKNLQLPNIMSNIPDMMFNINSKEDIDIKGGSDHSTKMVMHNDKEFIEQVVKEVIKKLGKQLGERGLSI